MTDPKWKHPIRIELWENKQKAAFPVVVSDARVRGHVFGLVGVIPPFFEMKSEMLKENLE